MHEHHDGDDALFVDHDGDDAQDSDHLGDASINLRVELDADAKPTRCEQPDCCRNEVVKNTRSAFSSDHENRFDRIEVFKEAVAHDELKTAAKAKHKTLDRQKLAKKVHGGIQVVDPAAKDKYGDLKQNVTRNVAAFERWAKMTNGLLENFVRYDWCGFAALGVVDNTHRSCR